MWKFIIFASCIPWVTSQFNQRDHDQSWKIKLAVPGAPGGDYPTLSTIPRTSFTCAGKAPGYYADQEANCQVFKVCTSGATYGFQSFLCPNGTLFNQAVFVCDWWMNVNCGKSQEFINKNPRFGKIQLGPQLIQDVKKMITHPMRNPYNSGFLRNNLVVMQEYKPPTEQFYPNGAIISNQNNNKNNIYVPYKSQYRNIQSSIENTNDINFAASTAAPQYFSNFNSIQNTPTKQYVDYQRTQNAKINTIQNGRNGYLLQGQKEPTPQLNFQKLQAQKTIQGQYNFNFNGNIQTKQKDYSFNKLNQGKPPATQQISQPPSFNNNNGVSTKTEAKQNLVSTEATPTIISKTIAFKTILPGEKPGRPKSRITFKTWILKPKNAKLIVENTSYTTPKSRVYKSIPQNKSEKLSSSVEPTVEPYVYDVPQNSLDLTDKNNLYFYNQPTTSNLIATTPNYNSRYDLPTTFRPTLSSRIYLTPLPDATIATTPSESLYESPSTYASISNTYIPPIESEKLSRQYLSPVFESQQLQLKKNARLTTASSSASPLFEIFSNKNNRRPPVGVTKQTQINTNNNNVKFTDVPTEEKVATSINNIIKNTFNVPQSTKKQISQYKQSNSINQNVLGTQRYTGSKEELTSEFPFVKTKSAKIVASPSTDLQPPIENVQSYVSSNKFSNLPYYKEPTNTIERTVSIKITLPERIAKYLFRNDSQTTSDDVEILNTGSSNYLVYANNLPSNSGSSPIPIGKLSLIKNSNLSNSQDLVFSFLADSLNAAKEYSNIAKQNIQSSTNTPPNNLRNNDDQRISNKISQLTSSQFVRNNNAIRNNNIQQLSPQSQDISRNKESSQFTSNRQQQQQGFQQPKLQQITTPSQPFIQNQLQAARIQDPRNNIQNAQNQNIYSGQLYQHPVPEVTRDYYNSPNNQLKQQNNDFEIIPSQQIPFSYQQNSNNQESSSEQNSIHTKELKDLIQSGNGITAQLQDSIVGTLPHPIESDKLLTYKKDQSYYIFSQLNNNDHENNQINNEKSKDKSNAALQFIPSVAFKLNDVNEQQNFLNRFNLNDFGVPQGSVNGYRNPNQRQDISTNIDYTVNHPNFGDRINKVDTLYDGSSSYNAPQTSYNYERPQQLIDNNQNSKIEDLDSNEPNGYPKTSPLRKFNT
ncbi:putative uncharacterized protein DDB_G0277255 isoform X1 [Colias croceus]|uniref:putative uncharacterized protein DDB_G0277255 isoform X1 n=1 Tax=Colias crocea TaxID=72248 RepID=UPI001E27FB4C|nr:putative uncharacterized protein DDB_G0277255 isoform X1 [Colias croceus]